MNQTRSSRNRIDRGSGQRRGSPSKSSPPKELDNSFTALAMSRASSFNELRASNKSKTCQEGTEAQGSPVKQSRVVKKIRGKQKTIEDMFVEDDFEAVSFSADDFTTTSATTATTKSSAAKLVPVKVETAVDMDPFANIDNGFSDWNYGSKQKSQAPPDKPRERRSRRRSSMSNVPLSLTGDTEAPKDESKEHRRRSRRSSLDLTLSTEKPPSRRHGDTSVSSGVSGKSSGSRSNSSHEKKDSSRREGSRDVKGRSNRKQRQGRRRASMCVSVESSTNCSNKEEAAVDPAVCRGTSRRASLSMVAGTNSSFNQEQPRRTRRASLDMAPSDPFPTGFASDKSGRATAAEEHEWDESGFKVIK